MLRGLLFSVEMNYSQIEKSGYLQLRNLTNLYMEESSFFKLTTALYCTYSARKKRIPTHSANRLQR